jgi:Na+-driven multidrug efflux pump
VPLAYGLSEWTPLAENGIWLGMLASTIAGVALNYWYYARGRWMRLRIVASAGAQPSPPDMGATN